MHPTKVYFFIIWTVFIIVNNFIKSIVGNLMICLWWKDIDKWTIKNLKQFFDNEK